MAVGDTPLKLTRDAKAAIQLAFEDLGGLPRLVEWANNPANLGTFYTQIWSKIIPKDVKAEVDGNITIEVVKFGDDYALQHGEDRVVMHDQNAPGNHLLDNVISDAIYAGAKDEDDNDEYQMEITYKGDQENGEDSTPEQLETKA